ncbi:aldose 1-epimerase [Telluria sp. Tellsp104]
MIKLFSPDYELQLCPDIGGAVARLRWRGRDILRPVTDEDLASGIARRLGMFPLMPYSNRVEDAVLLARTGARKLCRNVEGELHSLHGFGWLRAWQVVESSRDWAVLTLAHEADADWPYPCRARQTISLVDAIAYFELRLQNTGTEEMPAGLGFHPYFPAQPDTHLKTGWRQVWSMDERKLPLELVPVPPQADFSKARPIAGWHSDHCFTGWNGEATLSYPTHVVRVTSDPDVSRLVCFVPDDGRAIIALEPVTHINNAVALEARGVRDTGILHLAPGEEMRLGITISVHASCSATPP